MIGAEVCGTVEAAGDGVRTPQLGDLAATAVGGGSLTLFSYLVRGLKTA
jgi:NADPH:quinone reductase-like Zn-dependent oxidoreductase